jgi:hypothetical protein
MRLLATVFAIASGIIVLLGYFYPLPLLLQLRVLLTNWAVIIAAMTVLIGIYNLVAVHSEKISTGEKGSANSWVLIISLILTLVYLAYAVFSGSLEFATRVVADTFIVPVEASLMAILAVTLIYASIRLLRRRLDVMSVLFLIAAVLFLIAFMPTPFGPVPGDQAIAQFMNVFSTGGARGLLIGIALGVLLTGLRIIFGVDRPYGGQ